MAVTWSQTFIWNRRFRWKRGCWFSHEKDTEENCLCQGYRQASRVPVETFTQSFVGYLHDWAPQGHIHCFYQPCRELNAQKVNYFKIFLFVKNIGTKLVWLKCQKRHRILSKGRWNIKAENNTASFILTQPTAFYIGIMWSYRCLPPESLCLPPLYCFFCSD